MSGRDMRAATFSTTKLALAAGIAVILFTVSFVAILFFSGSPTDPTPLPYGSAQAPDEGSPAKTEPGDTYVPPIEPASTPVLSPTLAMPSVGISASIVDGGAEGGQMVLPDSSMVAQYTGAAPIEADDGSTVIAGHVNFTDGSGGALGTLHQVQEGTPVYLTDSVGELHEYVVTEMLVLQKDSLPYEIFRTGGERQLVIVTCSGDLENVNGELVYTQNLVVYTKPVAS